MTATVEITTVEVITVIIVELIIMVYPMSDSTYTSYTSYTFVDLELLSQKSSEMEHTLVHHWYIHPINSINIRI